MIKDRQYSDKRQTVTVIKDRQYSDKGQTVTVIKDYL
jgi:hypothetical protein